MKRNALVFALLGYVFISARNESHIGDPLPKGYYIVVAAYRIGQEKYMIDYSETLNRGGLHSKYGFDLSRNFYYVYLDYYTDFNESIRVMLNTRKDAGFDKAWVRIMKDLISTAEVRKPDIQPEEIVQKKTITPVESNVEVTKYEKDKVKLKVEEKKSSPLPDAKVIFRLYNPNNSEPVEGEVEIIDTEKSTLLKREKGNQLVSIPYPKTKNGKVTLVGNSFGYRKVQHELSLQTLKDSIPDYVRWDDDHYIIMFDVDRLHKGDIETLYNVYFFNDATVMLPESKYELGKLLDMLKSNQAYRIRLHGHTNGGGNGRIISMGPSKNFFKLCSDVKTGSGSARDLSLQRAITIKDWLVSNQIAAYRIETKGWGGSRMLHDKNSDKARRNVRVEVEVLAE